MEKERVMNLKLRIQRNLLIFLSQIKKHLNLSFDVAPKGLDTNAQSISGVQPTAQVTFEIGGKFCAEIRCVLNMC